MFVCLNGGMKEVNCDTRTSILKGMREVHCDTQTNICDRQTNICDRQTNICDTQTNIFLYDAEYGKKNFCSDLV